MLFFQSSTCIENLVRAGVFLLNCVTPSAEAFEAGVQSLKNGAEELAAVLLQSNATTPENNHSREVSSTLEIVIGATVGLLCVTGVVLGCRSIRRSAELANNSHESEQYRSLNMGAL
ncbi:MAG: hypothetical protein ABI597_04385 [Gammaproteobacteria bacterium]